MTLIDTSAWIEFLRDTDSPICQQVDDLLSVEIATCDATRMEVLAGPHGAQTCRLPDRRGCHSRRRTDRPHGYGFRRTGTAHELASRRCISSHLQLSHSRAHPFMPQSTLINAALLSHSNPGLMNGASGRRSYRANVNQVIKYSPRLLAQRVGLLNRVGRSTLLAPSMAL